LLALLKKLHSEGRTLVISTHDTDLAYAAATLPATQDELVQLIQQIRIRSDGTPFTPVNESLKTPSGLFSFFELESDKKSSHRAREAGKA